MWQSGIDDGGIQDTDEGAKDGSHQHPPLIVATETNEWASHPCSRHMKMGTHVFFLSPVRAPPLNYREAGAIVSPRTPWPAASNTASTAPSARTRSATPAPYRTGAAPSSRASVSSCSPTALITLIPRATASCVAMMLTDPPPPNSSSVSPLLTFSCRRTPTAASAELGSAAASIHETVSGLRVQIDASAYSAYPPRPNSRAVTPSPMDVPVTPGPTASTVPAASKPSTAFGGSGMALR